MPDAVPEIMHDDSGVHSIDSLNSPHISSVPSSYSDQQLADERAEEARQEASRTVNETSEEAKAFGKRAQDELSRLEKESGKKYSDFSAEAKETYQSWKSETSKQYGQFKRQASAGEKKAEKKAKKAEQWADDNKGNPVVIGNAVVIAALGGLLGVGAYRMHQAGTLTYKVAGAWAGVVGLFAVGDYYISQYVTIWLMRE
jgi:dsDNA-specific endonuclease/ATPase MutS2